MTTYLGKSCSFDLPRVPFVNCRQFMYLVISLSVLRAGCGIWLYQFLIIAYLFTFQPWSRNDVHIWRDIGNSWRMVEQHTWCSGSSSFDEQISDGSLDLSHGNRVCAVKIGDSKLTSFNFILKNFNPKQVKKACDYFNNMWYNKSSFTFTLP